MNELTPDEVAKLRDESRRGEIAQQVIDNAVYRDTMIRIRDKYVKAWMSLPLNDKENLHLVRLMLACHDSIAAEISTVLKTGQLAEFTLNHRPFRGKRARKDQGDLDG